MRYELPLKVIANNNYSIRMILLDLWPEIANWGEGFANLFTDYDKEEYDFLPHGLIKFPYQNGLYLEVQVFDNNQGNLIDELLILMEDPLIELISQKLSTTYIQENQL